MNSTTATLPKSDRWFIFFVSLAIFIGIACAAAGAMQENDEWNRKNSKESVEEKTRKGLIPLIVVILNAGVFVWVFHNGFVLIRGASRNRSKKKETLVENREADTLFALQELESGNIDKLTWAKALIKADGDETKAKAIYLKIRKRG